MKWTYFLSFMIIIFSVNSLQAQKDKTISLPDSICTGPQGELHVQGIAVDKRNGFIYCSFTDKLVKFDMSGHLIGSVIGLVGHLGDLTFDTRTDKIYASLEYKNDAIGKGIASKLGLKEKNKIGFYIAIFKGSEIIKPNMDAQKGRVLRAAYLKEVVDDYEMKVHEGNKIIKHRFGCSGIDGITLAPSIGHSPKGNKSLYVAYGIYGDTTRKDNDNQVILKYSLGSINELARKLTQNKPHQSGPKKPLAKYFVRTGNTSYGIQNLEYDPYTGNVFAAVYKGTKLQFPNYSLFVINWHAAPHNETITSGTKPITVQALSLLKAGLEGSLTGVRGWNFKWGSTGLFPLGDGLFYISHNKKTKDDEQEDFIYKYKWVGDENEAFKLIR